MRVYVKKNKKNPMLPGIIVAIIFLAFSLFVFSSFFSDNRPLIDKISSYGVALFFSILFFGFGTVVIVFLFKKPKAYKFKLVKKKSESYNGQKITSMKFESKKNGEKYEYSCYSIGDNNLVEGYDYVLKVKQYNWEPRYVEELSDKYKFDDGQVEDKTSKITISPVYYALEFAVAGIVVLCILGMIFYSKYFFTYLVVLSIMVIVLYKIINERNKMKYFGFDSSQEDETDEDLSDEDEDDEESDKMIINGDEVISIEQYNKEKKKVLIVIFLPLFIIVGYAVITDLLPSIINSPFFQNNNKEIRTKFRDLHYEIPEDFKLSSYQKDLEYQFDSSNDSHHCMIDINLRDSNRSGIPVDTCDFSYLNKKYEEVELNESIWCYNSEKRDSKIIERYIKNNGTNYYLIDLYIYDDTDESCSLSFDQFLKSIRIY